ncbi:TIGR03016 family PEP-CTERM system-associated outer membrane protein [Thalassotalea ponticola]|uniref:TIGR03016 family PEP-CTERM system-associated outer membrane protein n=1 Tax=Thalassotalea ponticola TaxID=1523392 RepID=UPI0035293733
MQPRLGVEEAISDNVELSEFDKEFSWVSLITPGFFADYKNSRVTAEVDYSYTQALYSHDLDLSDNFHNLLANGSVALKVDGLSVFGLASISNVAANDARNSLADTVSGDTVQYETYQAGLNYLVENSRFNVAANTSYSITRAGDSVGDRKGFNANAITSSGTGARTTFWQARANYSDYENNRRSGQFYSVDAKVGYISGFRINPFVRLYKEDSSGNNINSSGIQGSSSIGAGARWLISRQLFIDLSYNWVNEDAPAIGIATEEQDDYVSAEIAWKPSNRTNLRAQYYQRFFGDAYELQFRHRTKRLTTSVSYTERIDIFDRFELVPTSLIDIWCLTGTDINSNNCVLGPEAGFDLSDYSFSGFTANFELVNANSFSLTEALTSSVSLRLPRSSLTLSASQSDRTNLEVGSEDRYQTVRLSYDRQVNRTTDFLINTSFRYNALNNNSTTLIQQIDYYRIYRIGLNKRLNRTLEFTSYLQHLNRGSTRFDASYEENRISAQLTKRF